MPKKKKYKVEFRVKCSASCWAGACGSIFKRTATLLAESKEDASYEVQYVGTYPRTRKCPSCKREDRLSIWCIDKVEIVK